MLGRSSKDEVILKQLSRPLEVIEQIDPRRTTAGRHGDRHGHSQSFSMYCAIHSKVVTGVLADWLPFQVISQKRRFQILWIFFAVSSVSERRLEKLES